MSIKVIAIISQDEKLKQLAEKFESVARQGNIELEMHKNMYTNKKKEIKKSLDDIETEVALYLKDKGSFVGEVTEEHHATIDIEEDAIKLCVHDSNGEMPPFPIFFQPSS